MNNIIEPEAVEVFSKIKHYEYSYVFDLEKLTFNIETELATFMQKNWNISFYISIVYVLFIFLATRYLKNRPAFNLRLPLAVWSTVLAIFSIFASIRTLPEFLHGLFNEGLYYSVCCPQCYYGVTGFWAVMFVLSKPYELGDTVFIVLRKQKLIFLHWYHHITVMMYSWQSFSEHNAAARWFYVLNYVVHAFMYTYYAARAWRFRTPRWVNIFITALQIIQMVLGSSVISYTWYLRYTGTFCNISYVNSVYGYLMYSSYFVLFSHFFYNAYMRRPSKPTQSRSEPTKETTYHVRQSSDSKFMKDVTDVLKTVADIDRNGYVRKDD